MIGKTEKDIILTTDMLSNESIKEANRDDAPQIELIDGQKLVDMFKKLNWEHHYELFMRSPFITSNLSWIKVSLY